jgi:hypothetical protein
MGELTENQDVKQNEKREKTKWMEETGGRSDRGY